MKHIPWFLWFPCKWLKHCTVFPLSRKCHGAAFRCLDTERSFHARMLGALKVITAHFERSREAWGEKPGHGKLVRVCAFLGGGERCLKFSSWCCCAA